MVNTLGPAYSEFGYDEHLAYIEQICLHENH